jgi:flagellar biogenesis protein FliO
VKKKRTVIEEKSSTIVPDSTTEESSAVDQVLEATKSFEGSPAMQQALAKVAAMPSATKLCGITSQGDKNSLIKEKH